MDKVKFLRKWVTYAGLTEIKDGRLHDKAWLEMDEDLNKLLSEERKVPKAVLKDVGVGEATVLYDKAVAEMEKRREELIGIAERLKATNAKANAEANKVLIYLSNTIAF